MTERPRYFVLDAAGEPLAVDFETWVAWRAHNSAYDEDKRLVARDRDEAPGAPDVLISTVFLSLDHSFGDGPPVLWETLVFGGPLDGDMERYTTRSAAIAGHQAMCRRVAAALRQEPPAR